MTARALAIASGDTAETVRQALQLFMVPSEASALGRRTGLVPYAGSGDLTGVSPMVGRVAPFIGWIDGTTSSLQAGYPVILDANEDITFDAGEAGNTRIDRVVAQIEDNAYDASGFSRIRVRIVKGQAGGGANAVPASSMLLWEVTVPAGASVGGGGFTMSSVRSDKRQWTGTLGGLLIVKDSTDLATLTPYEGMPAYQLDTKTKMIYSNAAWRLDGPVISVVKTDNTFRDTTTTLTDDTQLSLTGLAASAKYLIEGHIIYAATQTGDFKFGWTSPSGSTMDWGVISKSSDDASGVKGTPYFDRQEIASTPICGGADGDNFDRLFAYVRGVLITSAAGTLTVKWAQGTSTGTSTAVHEGSTLTATRLV
jgi:hypothetical protein